ncbi:MAG: hypothetical protein Q7S27_01450 [Nanoarchaeota archaeon]|nr:hypothetical protein [Nanoarchaeota archaeon]
MMKRGASGALLVFILLIAIGFMGIGVWKYNEGRSLLTGNVVADSAYQEVQATPTPKSWVVVTPTPTPSCKDVQVPYEGQEEYMKLEYYKETVPYTDKECEIKTLVYSIENTGFDYDTCNSNKEECIKYNFFGGCSEKKTYCVDRSSACSLDIRNQDSEQGGTWTIKHEFFVAGSQTAFKSAETSVYLYPQTTKRIKNEIRVTSDGENGEANKNIASCNYILSPNLPQKQVCKDVIKYNEVQRTREVTAYRPVTKYRTERECD